MVRLGIGDRVVHVNGTHEGKLVDIDGETGYVLQSNGVEIEFPLARLKPWVAAAAPAPAGKRSDGTLDGPGRTLLASVPDEIRDAVARSYEKGDGRGRFAELTDKAKLEAIRIHLPSLPRQLLGPHLRLVVAFRDLARAK